MAGAPCNGPNAARMIPKPLGSRQVPDWQLALQAGFTRPRALLDYLELNPELPALAPALLRGFPLRVPRAYAARMQKGNPDDPLFRQVWPQPAEGQEVPGYHRDAVGDLARTRPGGLIHKYQGRALVIATGACAVHCRYCFRRHFPYGGQLAARDHWRETLATIAADPSLEEIILSGGDPLALADDKLAAFADALAEIPHVQRLRLHTRQPVVLPERVDASLLAWLGRGRLRKLIVLHVNHPQELGPELCAALGRLRALGLPLLNQSVLLRGVNDSATVLGELSRSLFNAGVLPYYLHLLDPVEGAAHFNVTDTEAADLMRDLSAQLPGYLLPRLVREIPGEPAKTPIAW
jgi:L-lysine 2,3-aminomutase